jgi:chromosome segregation ATPase
MLIPLIFFGAGMLFASLLWGKYKQLSIALGQKADRHEEAEKAIQKSMDELLAKHADQSTTCHTLEEELAHIATERESLMADLADARTEQTRLRDLESDHAAVSERNKAQEERSAVLQSELNQAKLQGEAIIAAENRAKQLALEKAEVLTLVGRLEEKLNTFVPLQKQLEEEQRTAQALTRATRLERIRRRRNARLQQEEAAKRRSRTTRKKPLHAVPTLAVVEPTPSPSSPNQINGHQRSGMAKRLLARLRPSAPKPRPRVTSPPDIAPVAESPALKRDRRHW